MTKNDSKPKVVLFHPHNEAGEYRTCQRLPLDILSISGIPDERGYQVSIIDATVDKDYQESVLRECKDAICFGITSIFGYQVYHSYTMAKMVKERYPHLPIVSGGWFPSVRPDLMLEKGSVDIVTQGQGELTFMELLTALESGSALEGINGLVYKENGELVRTPPRMIEDLNKMPPMPYHLIDFEKYFASDTYERAKRFIYASTGRDLTATPIRALDYFSSYGCPDNCTFCCSSGVTGRKWTALKAERMVDEIGHLVEKHHCNFLTFSDANWGVSQKRVHEFCEGLLDKGVEIYWGASVESHILNKFDPEVLKLMKKSGCVNLFIGAESADPHTLKKIQKNIDPGEIFHTCEICSKAGITPTISYMIGFPDETTESIQSTIEQGCEILYRWPQIELPILVFLPLPNTPLHDRAVEMGLPPADDIEYWSGYKRFGTELYNPVMRPMPELYSGITQKQLKTLRRCQMYYFWWGCERLKDSKKLTILEKILNKSSSLRLKYKILGFPIEYKLYYTLLRMLAALRRMK